MILNNLFLPLLITLIVEVSVSLLLNFRKREEVLAIIFINLLTNPVLNYFLVIDNVFNILRIDQWGIIVLEILVIFIEWGLLIFLFNQKPKGYLFKLSLLINLCSYLTGFLIF